MSTEPLVGQFWEGPQGDRYLITEVRDEEVYASPRGPSMWGGRATISRRDLARMTPLHGGRQIIVDRRPRPSTNTGSGT